MSEVEEQPQVETSEETISDTVAQETSTVEPQVDAPKVDVPKKFQKEDGSFDTERLLKSYTELEKKLHAPKEPGKKLGDILPSVSQPLYQPAETNYDDIYSNPEGVISSAINKAVAPYEAKLKYNEMAEAAVKAQNLPKFKDYENDVVEHIQKDPALNALFRMGDTSVFQKAYGLVLSNKLSDIETAAYERGRNEKTVIQNSIPKVEGTSSAPPAPKSVSQKERLAQLIKSGAKIEDILLDDALLSPAERKLFGKK